MDVEKTAGFVSEIGKTAGQMGAFELMIVLALAVLIIAALIFIKWAGAYFKMRFENDVARKVGYHAFQRGLFGIDDTMRLPTATGSETARIKDLSEEHIEIRYDNGDIGHIPYIGFEKLHARKVTLNDGKT